MNEVRIHPPVVAIVGRHQKRYTSIRIVGDLDMGGEQALADAIDSLSRLRPATIILDLTAVTFVGSVFAHFVASVHDTVPDALVVLRNPSPMARLVLELTGLDTDPVVCDGAEPA
jgi:anti-anti-sigma factor